MSLPDYWPRWYLKEAQDLVEGLLRRLHELEQISGQWQKFRGNAEDIGNTTDPDRMLEAKLSLAGQVFHQGEYFDTLESFLAAWARLSLLFFPSDRNGATAVFRRQRGQVVRSTLGIDSGSPLNDRELRNAWMHFDERLDQALLNGTLRNRVRFVPGAVASSHVGDALLLMEVDTLVIHYRTQADEHRSIDLNVLRGHLASLQERLQTAHKNPEDTSVS